MPKIIVSSRYMRNSPKKTAANLVKYMGTREGVEMVPEGIDRSKIPYSTLDLVRRNVPELAAAMKIDLDNLQWYAAFHNTTHHPHTHLLVYAKDARQGWMTPTGIGELKRIFGGDIFRNEQYMLFSMETRQRDLLKEKVDELLEQEHAWPIELQMQMVELAQRLVQHRGKKSYGYLKKKDKALVDEIVCLLASDPQVAAIYKEWDRVNREKLSLYYEKKDEPTPLEQNKEFRSLKNAVIRAAGLMLLEQSANETVQNTAVARALYRIAESFCKLVQESQQEHRQKLQSQIDSRLWEKIAEKKQAHGFKIETLREYDDSEVQSQTM